MKNFSDFDSIINYESSVSHHTKMHEENVSMILLQLCNHLNISNAEEYYSAAIHHDIGKMFIPRYILHYGGKLTDRDLQHISYRIQPQDMKHY